MSFGIWLGCWNSALDNIDHPMKSELLTLISLPSQEIFNTNIVANFLSFPMATNMLRSDYWFRRYDHWKLSVVAENIRFEPNEVTCRLRSLRCIEAGLEETLNIKVIGNFIILLKRVETQDFNTGRRNHEVLKLIEFSWYFKSEPSFKFLSVVIE
jgi:hypothetical protein